MKQKWKIGLSLLLAASMVSGAVHVNGQSITHKSLAGTVKKESSVRGNVTGLKTDKANEEKYAEGQAIILYNKADSIEAKASVKSITDDIKIVHTYDFDYADAGAKSSNTNKEKEISVSLVESDTYSTEELVESLKKRSNIRYAQPNYRIKASAVGSDTYKEFQWSLDNFGQNGGTIGADINAEELFNAETDREERVIALVDTGIDYTHEDLAAAVWTNPVQSKQLKGEHGYDFINYDEDPMDDNGHGTHCSGIMAASTGNGVGIAGVANNDNVKIMALKILDETGSGYGYEAVGAYNYIYKAQQLGVNVVAINNSWGMYGEDYILDTLINMVGENGAISVCAAGNEGANNDEFGSWPANSESPYVISVAASTENDELAPFSNYGMNSVDIAAPGTGILSSVSYNCFSPSIYENQEELCSVMHDFSDVNLVKTLDDNGYNDTVVTDNDFNYGITTLGGKADISLALSDKAYYGVNEENNKSLEWTLKGAEEGEIYYLYFPYTASESGNVYSSMMIKATGPNGAFEYDPFWEEYLSMATAVYVCDGPLDNNGVYDEDEEFLYYGLTVGEAGYWGNATGNTYDVERGDTRAVTVQLYVAVAGDYTINIDDFAIARSDIDEEAFGKYAFYDGTSMATPHVTGAVAAVAGAYSDESALEVKARILGSCRESESLKGKIATGGVLDLSKVNSPNMSVEYIYMDEDGLINIEGYYLDDVTVLIDEQPVECLETASQYIIIDGYDYINRNVDITLVKDDYSLTYTKFFAAGKNFEYGIGFSGALDGGNVISAGRTMYYVDQNGFVYRGTPTQEEGMKTLDWESLSGGYEPYVFGDDYSFVIDYMMINETEVIYANNSLWSVVTINAGYSESTALLMFDEECESWNIAASIPEEMENIEGYSIAAYNGDVYLFGGYDSMAHIYSTKVYRYNAVNMTWEEAAEMPEGRVYAKALQVDDKLVVTLGGNSENRVCKNMIFDGETWSVSEADMGTIYDTSIYVLDEGTEYEAYVEIAKAQIGIVDGGIIYTNICVEGMGDTFTYSIAEDSYAGTGYMLDRDSLYFDELYATTIQDDLYVIFGFRAEDDFEDWTMSKNRALSENYYDDDDEEYWDEYIELLSIPVETGFGNVIDESEEGVYVIGSAYYMPGDTVTITAKAQQDYFVKGMTVNGQKVNKRNGVYEYTIKRVVDKDIVACAQAGMYVTKINMPEKMILKQGQTAQLVAEVLPENAENRNIIWHCDSDDVTVDANGNVAASADAACGIETVIYASSQDRGYKLAECVVVVEKAEEKTVKAEEATTKAEKTTTASIEESKVPSVNSNVTVGKKVYRVVTNSKNSRTVEFVALKNKKAKKVVIPATIKLDGATYKVTGIAANAFKNSTKLKRVTIGKNVASIGRNAFKGCKKLRQITIKSKVIKNVKKTAFRGTDKKLVVKVPKKLKKQYNRLFDKAGLEGIVK